jgi:hypothetical protein
MLEEVAAGCERLRRIHDRVITELRGVISDELHDELQTLAVRFDQDSPTPSEVRVAQAELVGWLEGLMAGMVVTANTEATTDQAQPTLQQVRRKQRRRASTCRK